MENVVVLGASANPQRYSFLALKRLVEAGHQVVPVHPALEEIEGLPVVKSLSAVETAVDTVTVYVNSQRFLEFVDDVISLKPKRVILNPGTESQKATEKLQEAGIKALNACTLVMLSTGQF